MSDELAIRKEVSPVIQTANSLIVTNADEYSYGTDFLKKIKEAQKKVTDYFSPMKSKAHEAWKQICNNEGELLTPLKSAEDTTKRKLLNWKMEDDRKREEERRRLQAEADEKARIERERLEKQAEKLKTPELKEQRLEQAQNIIAPVIEVQTAVPKVEGISVRKIWKAELTDKAAFIKATANDPNLMALITVDMSALNRIASATKGGVTYPGVRFFEETTMASRF
ncbi:MAG: hypothetical protein PHV11_09300 [Candidatus Bipolaricaulis sp.]|jgi:hypothetical protein|nr:hypothetical protein [Candidatus Bipolaricaulis sp.]